MPKTWKGKESYELELVRDRQQLVQSTRYLAAHFLESGGGPERRFELYPMRYSDRCRGVNSPAGVRGAELTVSNGIQ